MTSCTDTTTRDHSRDADLTRRNLACLQELNSLLGAIDDTTYCFDNPLVDGSIGTHVRHLLEFYQNFVRQYSSGTICYVNRERCMNLETSVVTARQRLADLCRALPSIQTGKPLQVQHFGGALSQSCTTRELSYLLDHTVHHLALINVLARLAGVHLPEQFGFSSSTVAHRAAS